MNDTEKHTDKQAQLKQFIEAEKGRLLPILCLYAVRAQLATLERSANTMAAELLNDVVIEALDNADQFDPSRQPFAWLMRITSSLVQRRQEWRGKSTTLGQPSGREPALTEDEVIDRLTRLFGEEPKEQDQPMFQMLNRISMEDQRVLRLAVHHDLDGEALAEGLSMPSGAARVRLHRALDHLRSATQE